MTGVPIMFLLTRGQQIKVLSQLYRKAGQHNLLIPYMHKQGGGARCFRVSVSGFPPVAVCLPAVRAFS